jgi:hypothetical protein
MTNAELIAILQGFPPELPILIPAYEGNYEPAEAPQVMMVHPSGFTGSCVGSIEATKIVNPDAYQAIILGEENC